MNQPPFPRLADPAFAAVVRAFVAAADRAGTLRRCLPTLRYAVEAFRPAPHVLTSLHTDFVTRRGQEEPRRTSHLDRKMAAP